MRDELEPIEISPEDFAHLTTREQVIEWDAFQLQAFELGKLMGQPLPDTKDKRARMTIQAFAANRGMYNDDIEDKIADDEVLKQLRPNNTASVSTELAQAIRARRSVLAATFILAQFDDLGSTTTTPTGKPIRRTQVA